MKDYMYNWRQEKYLVFNRVMFSVFIAICASLISFILFSGGGFGNSTSPLIFVWGMLNIIPYFLSVMLGGNGHAPDAGIYGFLVFIQWSAFGFGLSTLLFRKVSR